MQQAAGLLACLEAENAELRRTVVDLAVSTVILRETQSARSMPRQEGASQGASP
jgi:hypothetical protein